MDSFDCAVIGAGPAGATAAYELARLGRSALLLEKAKLPRYKPCGGGVSPQVQEWLGFDLSPAVSHVATRMRATWCMGDSVEDEIPDGACVWMVRREVFDHFLARKAVEKGAELREETCVSGAEWRNGAWALSVNRTDRKDRSDCAELEARFVIAADGSKGQAARWLGFSERKRQLAGAFEAEAPLVVNEQDGVIHLEFGLIRGGYLWNFPKSDAHSVGIGAFKGQAPKNMKELLGEYSASFEIDLAKAAQYGHPVAVWDGHFPLHGRNALLAGEAACVVDPFTAEGIRPAIYSGIQAARAIHAALGGESRALEGYSRVMREEHGADMAWARRIAKLFYALPKIAYENGVKRPDALGFMGGLLTGKKRYRDVALNALGVFAGGIGAR